jgi:hypothetical protein
VIRDFIADSLIPAVEDSIADVQTVMDRSGFEDGFTFLLRQGQELPPDALSDVQIDSGDVVLLKAGLLALKGALQLIAAHDMNVGIEDLINFMDNDNIQGLLDAYPAFLQFVADQTLTASASGTLSSALDAYNVASELIRTNPDGTTAGTASVSYEEFISFDAEDLQEEAVFRENLARLKNSLETGEDMQWLGPHSVDGIGFRIGNEFYGVDILANPNPMLNGQVPLRDILPEFAEDGLVMGTMGHELDNDPTLGGIFPTMTQQEWTETLVDMESDIFAGELDANATYPLGQGEIYTSYFDGTDLFFINNNTLYQARSGEGTWTYSLTLNNATMDNVYEPLGVFGYNGFVYVVGNLYDWSHPYIEIFEKVDGSMVRRGDPVELEELYSMNVDGFKILVDAGYAFFRQDPHIRILDLRDGAHPHVMETSIVHPQDSMISDFDIDNGKIYVLYHGSEVELGVYAMDGDNVQEIGLGTISSYFHTFVVDNERLFGMDELSGNLLIYDVHDPDHIQLLAQGEVMLDEGFWTDYIEVKDNVVVLMGFFEGMLVDISNLESFVPVARIEPDAHVNGIRIIENELYALLTAYDSSWNPESSLLKVYDFEEYIQPLDWSEYPPVIASFDCWGVALRNREDGLKLVHDISVVDQDGVSSGTHRVEVKFPGDEDWRDLYFEAQYSSNEAGFWKGDYVNATDVVPGVYTYRVTDNLSGEQAFYEDTLAAGDIQAMALAQNLQVDGDGSTTTPLLTWDAVDQATHYQVRIYDSFDNRIWQDRVDTTAFRVPAGILQGNMDYAFFVRSYPASSHIAMDIDCFSQTPKASFSTGDEAQTPTIFANLYDGIATWNGPLGPANLYSWALIGDEQGITSLKRAELVFPDNETRLPLYPNVREELQGDSVKLASFTTDYYGIFTAGNYTVEVEDADGNEATCVIELTDNVVLEPPVLDEPVIGEDKVTFTWSKVQGAQLYQLQFKDQNKDDTLITYTLEAGDYDGGTMSQDVPLALAQKGQAVAYRVKAIDDYIENRPSAWSASSGSYYMPTMTPNPEDGLNTPNVMLDKEGVYLVHVGNPQTNVSEYRLGCWIGVGDLDGVPADIANATLYDPNNAKVMDLVFVQGSGNPSIGFYEGEKIVKYDDVLDGTYTIVVTDQAGRTDTIEDDF